MRLTARTLPLAAYFPSTRVLCVCVCVCVCVYVHVSMCMCMFRVYLCVSVSSVLSVPSVLCFATGVADSCRLGEKQQDLIRSDECGA